MSLIKCDECGKEVSSKAKSCPNCGNPISIDKSIKIKFPKNSNQIFNTGCTVFDDDGDILSKCKQGEVAEIFSDEPIDIEVKMSGCFGTAKITAEPGGRYEVNVRALGSISISKVDIL